MANEYRRRWLVCCCCCHAKTFCIVYSLIVGALLLLLLISNVTSVRLVCNDEKQSVLISRFLAFLGDLRGDDHSKSINNTIGGEPGKSNSNKM